MNAGLGQREQREQREKEQWREQQQKWQDQQRQKQQKQRNNNYNYQKQYYTRNRKRGGIRGSKKQLNRPSTTPLRSRQDEWGNNYEQKIRLWFKQSFLNSLKLITPHLFAYKVDP